MTINAFTGLPGSGKSYGVVEHVIVPALKRGRMVWTNIPFNAAAMSAYAGSLPQAFHVDDIRNNPRWFQDVLPAGVVLVLDECWRLWPAGLKANNIAEPHKSFLAEHRHLVGEDGFSTEIYLVTQDLAQIAAFARQLVESTYRAHKLAAVGLSKKFRVDIYDGGVTGAKPPRDKRVRQIFGRYRPEIYALYQSHTMSETGQAGDETSSDGRKNILQGWAAKSILAVIVLGTIFAAWGLSRVRESYAPHSPAVPVSAAGGRPVAPAAPPRPRGLLDGKTIYIASNLYDGIAFRFRFRVQDGDAYSVVPTEVLEQIGYHVTAMGDCLALITGNGVRLYAQCRRQHERESLNLVAATADAAQGGG
jgi:zona occludens toxin